MSLVNEKSKHIFLPQFELFTDVPIQTTIENTRIEEIRPLSQLNTGSYIEFDINSNFNEYINLEDIFLYVRFRVKLNKIDKSPITREDWYKVSTVNNILHSMWNQVDLAINDIQTTISLLTYSQKAYLNTILYSTECARKSYLAGAGYHANEQSATPQSNSLLDQLVLPNNTNVTDLKFGKIVELCGRPFLDFLNQKKYLIGGTKLRLKFVMNRPEFLFMLTDSNLLPTIEFLDVFLELPKCLVSDNILIAQNRAIKISPAKYPIDRFEVRTQTIDKGVTGKNLENIINGQLPKKIFVTLVENEAFNGSYTMNPFNYKHFDINSLACFVNGKRFEYNPDFDQNLYLREYMGLCKVTNQANNDNRMVVNLMNFKEGYTIFAYDLSQDGYEGFASNGYVNPPREGFVRFELHFKKPTPTTLNILFFCEFDNQISITEERNPIVDY